MIDAEWLKETIQMAINELEAGKQRACEEMMYEALNHLESEAEDD